METFFIRDLETLQIAFRPPRPAILEKLKQAMTVTELAGALREPASRLYYHVNELERIGLLKVVAHRDRGNLREKVYRVVAPSLRVDPVVFQSVEGHAVLLETVLAVMHAASESYRRAASADQITAASAQHMVHTHDELRLPPAEVEELAQRTRALVEEYRARNQPALPVSVQLTALVIPVGAGT